MHAATRTRWLAPALLAWSWTLSAQAAVTPCPSGDTSLFCRLRGVLDLLSATAVILGALLVLAIIAAVWYYRRNRNKDLLPR